MTTRDQMLELQGIASRASAKSSDQTRHKCFVSYRVTDLDEVETFLDEFGSEFIPRTVGVTEEDDFVASDDDEYIKRRIREKYLADSSVTILMLGKCNWSRKFIDWEISASLRNDSKNRRNGLLAIPLPSMENSTRLPDRMRDNWVEDKPESSFAVYRRYPDSLSALRNDIDTAFQARTSKAKLVNNRRALRRSNSLCA